MYKGKPLSKFSFKGVLDDTFLKGGPDNVLGFKKGKSSQNEWNALWKSEI